MTDSSLERRAEEVKEQLRHVQVAERIFSSDDERDQEVIDGAIEVIEQLLSENRQVRAEKEDLHHALDDAATHPGRGEWVQHGTMQRLTALRLQYESTIASLRQDLDRISAELTKMRVAHPEDSCYGAFPK